MSRKRKFKIRAKLLERDGYQCYWCGEQLDDNSLTVDHVKPRSQGQWYNVKNLVISCYPCNHLKGQTNPWVWIAALVSDQDTESWLREHRKRLGRSRQQIAQPSC